MNRWIMFAFAVLTAIILSQVVDIVQAQRHNRQYDVNLHQKRWADEWPKHCAKERKKMLDGGWMLEPRPELDKIIEKEGY